MIHASKAPSVSTTDKAVRKGPCALPLFLVPGGLGVLLRSPHSCGVWAWALPLASDGHAASYVTPPGRRAKGSCACLASWPLGALCQLRTSESPYRVHARTPPHSIPSPSTYMLRHARPLARLECGPGHKLSPLRPEDRRMHATSEGARDHKMHAASRARQVSLGRDWRVTSSHVDLSRTEHGRNCLQALLHVHGACTVSCMHSVCMHGGSAN